MGETTLLQNLFHENQKRKSLDREMVTLIFLLKGAC